MPQSFQLPSEPISVNVRVSKEHPRIGVTGNDGDFGHRQAEFEEPRNRLVPQIVEAQVLYAGPFSRAFP